MSVYRFDPLRDRRWSAFLESHLRASVFHSIGWLEALRATYGYEPFALTTTPHGEALRSAVSVCRVRSWFGKRLVSLPFSDHCEPLAGGSDLQEIVASLEADVSRGPWTYLEMRPRSVEAQPPGALERSASYSLHTLDLSPSIDTLFAQMHPSCMRRAVRRAEKEALRYEEGSSPALFASFYRLLCMTRRRHSAPPPPRAWFDNLATYMGSRLRIRVASKDGRAIAAILTLGFKRTLVYKYGCSDASLHKLGGMPFLFWKAIQEAKEQGFSELDLGRSDADQPGLVTFKDHLGAARSTLTYYRYATARQRSPLGGWKSRAAKRLFARLPDPAMGMAGRLLYRHFG